MQKIWDLAKTLQRLQHIVKGFVWYIPGGRRVISLLAPLLTRGLLDKLSLWSDKSLELSGDISAVNFIFSVSTALVTFVLAAPPGNFL